MAVRIRLWSVPDRVIDAPVARSATDPTRMAVRADGRAAVTGRIGDVIELRDRQMRRKPRFTAVN